jgi:hypothetical protein
MGDKTKRGRKKQRRKRNRIGTIRKNEIGRQREMED